MTEYFQMPALTKIDNFEKCMEASHDLEVYCAVNSFIKPDRNNDVWNIIEVWYWNESVPTEKFSYKNQFFARDTQMTQKEIIVMT